MSSTALTLVNNVLLLTGDNAPVATITGSPGSIAERIVAFMNLTLSDIEKRMNWPELRSDSTGFTDGINDTYEVSGVGFGAAESVVSVWIEGHTKLQETSPGQFDKSSAELTHTGLPAIFQRKSGVGGSLQIQVFPLPAAGLTLHTSAYKKATRFTNVDTSTTELDDSLITYGALMHMDAYDGMNRGYADLFKSAVDLAVARLYSNTDIRITAESYA